MNVAVLMPVFNCEDTINQTIQSLQKQSYSDFTLYVINNNCSDKTIEIVKGISDSRIAVFDYNTIQKCSAALNYGLDIIKENIICRADGDDTYHPNYIQYYVDELRKNKHKIVYGSYRFNYHDGRVENTTRLTDQDLLVWRLIFFNTVDHNVGYDREYINLLGQYNMLLHSEDYDLWLRSILYNPDSISGIQSTDILCECYKSKTCMTEKYKHSNDINVRLSCDFIRKYLNVPVDSKIICKIKNNETLDQQEKLMVNCILDAFCRKRKVTTNKLNKFIKEFQFYV